MDNTKITEKASELGLLLAESEEFKRFKRAEMAQQTDELACALIAAFQQKRQEAAITIQEKNLTGEDAQVYIKEVEDEYNILLKNEVINEYLEAHKAFEALFGGTMAIVEKYVAPSNGGCGSDCSSCGGCH